MTFRGDPSGILDLSRAEVGSSPTCAFKCTKRLQYGYGYITSHLLLHQVFELRDLLCVLRVAGNVLLVEESLVTKNKQTHKLYNSARTSLCKLPNNWMPVQKSCIFNIGRRAGASIITRRYTEHCQRTDISIDIHHKGVLPQLSPLPSNVTADDCISDPPLIGKFETTPCKCWILCDAHRTLGEKD